MSISIVMGAGIAGVTPDTWAGSAVVVVGIYTDIIFGYFFNLTKLTAILSYFAIKYSL